MKKRVFFDTDPSYNCTRIESPANGEFHTLPPTAIDVRIVDESEIPTDRTFRNAWKADLSVDMPKARELHRKKMRLARAPKMAALDVEQLKGNNVEAKKQALRDVTSDPAIDAAKTPEELKSVWPAALHD
jgi:5-formyltetrahydrofolate cyclo-ligase